MDRIRRLIHKFLKAWFPLYKFITDLLKSLWDLIKKIWDELDG